MNAEGIGRNYAEALLTLARKSGDVEDWGGLIDAISVGMREDHTLKTFLESPKLSSSHKIEILEKALGGGVPPLFLRFLEIVINKRRQMLIPEIASEYRMLIDESEDRVHAAYDLAAAHRFWRALVQADRLFKLFRSGFLGKVSPVHFFLGGLRPRRHPFLRPGGAAQIGRAHV